MTIAFRPPAFLRIGLAASLLLLTAVAQAEDSDSQPSEPGKNKPPPREKRVYYFEHRLLPNWTHHSEGAFLLDLVNNSDTRLREAATEVVDEKFARRISWQVVQDLEAAVITFEKPRELAHCYHVAVVRVGEGFRYFTLERSLERGICVLGEWTVEGVHLNYGPRRYTREEPFLAEIRNILADPDPPINAATRPAAPDTRPPQKDNAP